MFETNLTFSDVLITPKFSEISSRKDVSTETTFLGYRFKLPILSANMDTISGLEMARAMNVYGAAACLHRFWSIDENVATYKASECNPWTSVGLGRSELERASALFEAGSTHLVLDVANGASQDVVLQVMALRGIVKNNACIIVGNFATGSTVKEFQERCNGNADAFKVGIGPGSVCSTRSKTGVGFPQLSALTDCVSTGEYIIADGGMNEPGDVCKALGAGAKLVMSGRFFAGCKETPTDVIYGPSNSAGSYSTADMVPVSKKYRGSASKESYEVQGKLGAHRTAEGESILVPYKGPVADVLSDIEGGLRSAMTYTNSKTLEEFWEHCDFVRISNNTVLENGVRK